MATSIKNGQLITAGSTSDTEYVFSSPIFGTTLFIEVVSSSSGIQFAVGESIDSSHALWTTGAKFPITINTGVNLHAKASNSADTWRVTV